MNRLNTYFDEYFSDTTKPTARNLFLLVIAILTLDTFRSVRFAHGHVLSKLTDTSLNAYYYTLRTDACDHSRWGNTTVLKAVRTIPDTLRAQPLFLSIDDTMVEKFGKKFELCSKLFDHAAHNGSNYLNGHCMVSILLSFPVWKNEKIQYLSVPLEYRLWDKEKSKLAVAAEMVRQAMGVIGSARQVFLLCDSWYPKAEVAGLIKEFKNLDMICNARVDTAMYELPPAPTGKRGRPRKYGKRISPKDFELSTPQTGDWMVGVRPVLTRLWGERVVYAFVTASKKGGDSRRLFFCTKKPDEIPLDYRLCADERIRKYGEEDRNYLPLACYLLRWNIEISYYEGKTFWSLEEYRIRSREGIERLVNLLAVSYSAMTLLPYSDGTFSAYQSFSAQETRFEIGQQIQASIIFNSFVESLETVKKAHVLIRLLESHIQSWIGKV